MKFMWIFLIKAGLTLFFVNQITSNGHSTYLRCLLWTLYINIYAFQARYDCGSGHVQSNCGIYEHNHVLKVLNNNSLLKHILNFVVLDRSYSSFHSRLGKFLASFINCITFLEHMWVVTALFVASHFVPPCCRSFFLYLLLRITWYLFTIFSTIFVFFVRNLISTPIRLNISSRNII